MNKIVSLAPGIGSNSMNCRGGRLRMILTASVIGVARVAMGQQDLIRNGNFESGPSVNVNGIAVMNEGSAVVTHWTVTRGQIDYCSSVAWQAAGGSHSLDLAGSPGDGGIMQSIQTVANEVYIVRFMLAANPNTISSPAVIKRLRVRAGNQLSSEFMFDRTGHSVGSMGWRQETWAFTATGVTTAIELFNTTPGDVYGGPAIDEVSVYRCIAFTAQPSDISSCLSGKASFVVATAGLGMPTYQWQYEASPATWVNAVDGVIACDNGIISASNVNENQLQLVIDALPGAQPIRFRCIVTNSCASITSDPARLVPCQSDLTCDNVVDDEDFVVFAAAYNVLDCADPAMAAGCAADLNGDGLVDDSDFVVFVAAYNNLGCL